MSDAGRTIIEGLQDAVRGNVTRVTIDGQVWVRHDVGSPEHALASARAKIAELTTRVDALDAEITLLKKRLADAQGIIHRRNKKGAR